MSRIFLASALALSLLLSLGFVAQSICTRLDDRRRPSKSELILLPDGRRLHMRVAGQGLPVIVLESGGGLTLGFWTALSQRLAGESTVVSYDRAGVGWSDPSDADRGPAGVVDDLAAALRARRLPGPYILVGHSIGGLYVRRFASAHPDLTAGLVLLDPTVEGWRTLPPAMTSGVEALQHQIGAWRALVSLGVGRIWNPMMSAAGGLPAEAQAAHRAATNRDAHLSSTQRDGALLLAVGDGRIVAEPLGDIPLRVISAGLGGGPTLRAFEAAQWDLHRKAGALSSASEHLILGDANHITLITSEPFVEEVAREVSALSTLVRPPQ